MEFNLAQIFGAVAAANPDRDCIVFGDRRSASPRPTSVPADSPGRCTGGDLARSANARSWHPTSRGRAISGCTWRTATSSSKPCSGAYQARVAPFNVNYRYVADELVYLLGNAGADALMYHARFAPTLALALDKA